MKTKGLFIALCLLAAVGARAEEVKGNGVFVTKEIAVAPFESIRIGEGFKKDVGFKEFIDILYNAFKNGTGNSVDGIKFSYSQAVGDAALRVTIDENLFPYLVITSSGGVLSINTDIGVKIKPGKLDIVASSANLKEVKTLGAVNFGITTPLSVNNLSMTIGGGGNIVMPHPVRVNTYTVSISGSGILNAGDLACSKMSGFISGSGNFNVTGEADEVNFSISGSGDVNALHFKTKKTEATVSGSGNINVYATELLDAKIFGSGDIRYKGNPASLQTNISGSGSIKRIE